MSKICTLILLRKEDQLLLAMKKRGFGAGRWNGIGGKVEAGETIEQAMERECFEEIRVTPTTYHKVAVHQFVFPDGTPDMTVHTFLCSAWQGEPVETEEMVPQWFPVNAIPYNDMWQDDIIWLPLVLNGKLLNTVFTFDKADNLLKAELELVSGF